MLRFAVRTLSIVVTAAMIATPARAQVVASTFGPGDTYGSTGWLISPFQSIAQGFNYTGDNGFLLSQIRLAVNANAAGYNVSFLTGADMNSASILETWTGVAAPTARIISVESVFPVALMSGQRYYVAMSSSGSGRWRKNSIGALGSEFAQPSEFEGWDTCPDCLSAAYDVTVSAAPEPASIALLATGFVGLVGIQVRRRRSVGR